ncbi:MAG TPA: protein kinase, partial [Gemmatimonadaceae bacterium]|nr:protein kinase [Gemmatimonadaceae bacterium]
ISAARTSTAGDHDAQHANTLTQAGSAIGTPAYMAPEQAVGDSLDHRADIYAWGLVAYEILAGTHPFADKTTAAQVIAAHLSQPPTSLSRRAPDLPLRIADLIMRCLEKNPDSRPASATELLRELDMTAESGERQSLPVNARRRYAIAAAAIAVLALLAIGGYTITTRSQKTVAAPKSSVAVLPFSDDAADSANAYFGEGMADELMTALGKVPGLRVASRTSAIAIGRKRDLDVREIANRLGVSTVVEGTVRRSGQHLRITAQLTNAADGLTLWSDVYDRENKDVFAVQSEITKAIVAALRPEFAGTANAGGALHSGPGTANLAAYDLYLRGAYLVEHRGAGVPRAAQYFTQAISQDTTFARAYGALASTLELFPYFAGIPAHSVEARARAAAEKSLEIDPTLAEPRVALAMMHWHAFRWKEAEAEFRKAIAADSTLPVAHTQYGRFLVTLGRLTEALQQFRTARALDPLAPTASVWVSHVLSLMGNHAAAWEESKRAREIDPNLFTARTLLSADRAATGQLEEARAILGEPVMVASFAGQSANTLHLTGDTSGFRKIQRYLETTPDTSWMIHMSRAYMYLAARDTSRALSEMEKALDAGELVPQQMLFIDRILDGVRQSSRFAAIVRKLGLSDRGFTSPTGGRPAP